MFLLYRLACTFLFLLVRKTGISIREFTPNYPPENPHFQVFVPSAIEDYGIGGALLDTPKGPVVLECLTNKVFSVRRENFWFKSLKLIGYVSEYQTGDNSFDASYFLSSDDPSDYARIFQKENVTSFARLFEYGATKIVSDGKLLSASFREERIPPREILQAFSELADNIKLNFKPLALKSKSNFKINLVESTVTLIAAYAGSTLFLLLIDSSTNYINPYDLVFCGLILGVLLWIVLTVGAMILCRGHGRSAFLILESALVLAFSCPIIGPQILADINEYADSSPATIIERTVLRKVSPPANRTFGRRRSWFTVHRAILVPSVDPVASKVPDTITVSLVTFMLMNENAKVRITYRNGGLGFAWLEKIETRKAG